ncbi:MAG: restriction endonuclease, SacI family [Gammaproteobacteria bacterium]|nr:restriction endonuclease, SacI family [Gammaproteobacteria bacterium]
MDNDAARKWLDEEWSKALDANEVQPDPEIDDLTNAGPVSVRYALVTQLLGKIADPMRSLYAVQQADGDKGGWDARSFSTSVVVPWVADAHHVIGTSAEPYASKPLRRQRIEHNMQDVRDKADWERLITFFDALESTEEAGLREAFGRVLRSLTRRLAAQTFSYPIPQRISLPQLQAVLGAFLSSPSGGLRLLAATTALLRVIGEGLSLFSRVESQGINEADKAGGVPGDVICYCHDDPERICLVAEVKDIKLTLAHVQSSSLKAKRADEGLSSLLFTVPDISEADRSDIERLATSEWASGMNIYTASIESLISSIFVLLSEDWRIRFLRAIGQELDERQDQIARKAWHDLLASTSG